MMKHMETWKNVTASARPPTATVLKLVMMRTRIALSTQYTATCIPGIAIRDPASRDFGLFSVPESCQRQSRIPGLENWLGIAVLCIYIYFSGIVVSCLRDVTKWLLFLIFKCGNSMSLAWKRADVLDIVKLFNVAGFFVIQLISYRSLLRR